MDDVKFQDQFTDWKKRVETLDQKLQPIANREVDINAPDWAEKLDNEPHPADESDLRQVICVLFNEIIDQYELLNTTQRQMIIDLLDKNDSLMWSAVIDYDLETEEGFRRNMLLFVLADQGKDSRDAIVALSHYRNQGEKRGYDVDGIFKQMAQLASDNDKYGWGSTRELLKKG